MDFTARSIQIISYIGNATPLDISSWVKAIAPIAASPLDTAGYIKVEMSMTLVGTLTDLETRFNPRWAAGSKIEIWIANSLGVLVKHRTLRVLNALYREPDARGAVTLDLSLGDLFAYRDVREPSPGDVDIPILENTPDVNVVTTVNYWLRVFGLPTVTVLPGDESPGDRIVTTGLYNGGSSIMEHIGSILYANSRFVLWVDAEERVRLRRAALRDDVTDYWAMALPTDWPVAHAIRQNPYYTYTEGFVQNLPQSAIAQSLLFSDLLFNERSRSEAEKPATLVRVLGASNFKHPYSDPPSESLTTNDNGVTLTETVDVDTTPTSRTVTRSGTMVLTGSTLDGVEFGTIGNFEEITIETYGGFRAGFANSNPLIAGTPDLPNHLQSTSYTLREQRLQGTTLQPLATTKTVTTTYQYRDTSESIQGIFYHGVEIQQVIETTKILPEGATVLFTEQVRTQRWRKLDEGIYTYSDRIVRPRNTEDRVYTQARTNVGESTPPRTVFAPSMVVDKVVGLYAQAEFVGEPRSRSYNFGAYLDSNRGAKLMAEHLGAVLIGRNEAQHFAFRPTDAWLADPYPLPWVEVEYSPTERNLYQLDMVSLFLEEKRCYLGGTGIWYGRRAIATGDITPPYELNDSFLIDTAGDYLVFDDLFLEAA